MAGKPNPTAKCHQPCAVTGCGRTVGYKGGKGYCSAHLHRFARTGDPLGSTPRKSRSKCQICGDDAWARRLCALHYGRLLRTGNTELQPRPSFLERFWQFVEKTEKCWIWLGSKHVRTGHGYFTAEDGYTVTYAHRASWMIHFGDIPDGYQINHECNNPCATHGVSDECTER